MLKLLGEGTSVFLIMFEIYKFPRCTYGFLIGMSCSAMLYVMLRVLFTNPLIRFIENRVARKNVRNQPTLRQKCSRMLQCNITAHKFNLEEPKSIPPQEATVPVTVISSGAVSLETVSDLKSY